MYAESICYYYYDFRRFINNVTNKTADAIENGRSSELHQTRQECAYVFVSFHHPKSMHS